MKEEFVSYEQAKALKELGFLLPCDHYYCAFDNETDVRFWSIHPAQSNNGFRNPDNKVIADAPTLSLAQKWLREVKGIAINVIAHDGGKYHWELIFLPNSVETVNFAHLHLTEYNSYESALSAGISAALNLLTEKQ